MKDLYHQRGPIHYQASPNYRPKRIYYSDFGCQQQDVCGIRGHLEARKNTNAFQKASPDCGFTI